MQNNLKQIVPENYRFAYQGLSRTTFGSQFAEEENETGWNQFEERMYYIRIGRWMNFELGVQYASLYMAKGNNPTSIVDPDEQWKRKKTIRKAEKIGLSTDDVYQVRDGLFPTFYDYHIQIPFK